MTRKTMTKNVLIMYVSTVESTNMPRIVDKAPWHDVGYVKEKKQCVVVGY